MTFEMTRDYSTILPIIVTTVRPAVDVTRH
jgi:hypothetical protein